MRLYVGNISYETTEQDLRDYFDEAGFKVTDAKVLTERDTGRSRGFGFVTLADDQNGDEAIQQLNQKEFMGRRLVVNEAREKSQTSGGRRHGNGSRGRNGGDDRW